MRSRHSLRALRIEARTGVSRHQYWHQLDNNGLPTSPSERAPSTGNQSSDAVPRGETDSEGGNPGAEPRAETPGT
jgi:hypothetical protein